MVKISKFDNFVNNRPIFTGFVLNDLFYRVLHFFFCVKVDFINFKQVRRDPPLTAQAAGRLRAVAGTTRLGSGTMKISKSGRNLKLNVNR